MLKLFIRKTLFSFLFLAGLLSLYFWFRINLKDLFSQEHLLLTSRLFFILAVLAVFYFLQKSLAAFFDWYKESVVLKTKTELDDNFLPLFSRTASVILWSICLMIILSRFGININAILATLGVGSLAIALAAQDTIANLIAGFLIMIDRPFVVGDTIKLPTG
ncbi:MAG: mechanosensitive ion channel family protein, partial [Candidatus Margulisbacteria bacterium]|nr:mechanosensitive ion channel family protein [Candidatus Margulisiibacteriota bacterium]